MVPGDSMSPDGLVREGCGVVSNLNGGFLRTSVNVNTVNVVKSCI